MAATLWLLCARCGFELTVTNASTVLGHGCPRCGDRAVDITDLAPEGGDEPWALASINHGPLVGVNCVDGPWRRCEPWNGIVRAIVQEPTHPRRFAELASMRYAPPDSLTSVYRVTYAIRQQDVAVPLQAGVITNLARPA